MALRGGRGVGWGVLYSGLGTPSFYTQGLLEARVVLQEQVGGGVSPAPVSGLGLVFTDVL